MEQDPSQVESPTEMMRSFDSLSSLRISAPGSDARSAPQGDSRRSPRPTTAYAPHLNDGCQPHRHHQGVDDSVWVCSRMSSIHLPGGLRPRRRVAHPATLNFLRILQPGAPPVALFRRLVDSGATGLSTFAYPFFPTFPTTHASQSASLSFPAAARSSMAVSSTSAHSQVMRFIAR